MFSCESKGIDGSMVQMSCKRGLKLDNSLKLSSDYRHVKYFLACAVPSYQATGLDSSIVPYSGVLPYLSSFESFWLITDHLKATVQCDVGALVQSMHHPKCHNLL